MKHNFICTDELNHEIATDERHIFNFTIPRAEEKHNGTFTFWILMTTGHELM